MKTCRACNKEKPEEAYNWRNKAKGKRNPTCRECMRNYLKNHYYNNVTYYVEKAERQEQKYRRETYQKIFAYLTEHPCVDCGENDPLVLEFDHMIREDKLAEVSTLISHQRPWRIVFNEIQKCQVRCANCHRRKTAREQNWSLYIISMQQLSNR